MTKQELRKIYKEKRVLLSDKDRSRLDDLLLIQLQQLSLPFLTSLMSFWPIGEHNEPNTHLFTDYLEFKNPGSVICYPVASFENNQMRAAVVDEGTGFAQTAKGIYEPITQNYFETNQLDLVFVPLLICDAKGFRVGYGKGFYDRFLSACKPDCIKIGFSYFEPIDQIADKNQYDVPLNYCITPATIYAF